jgi:GTP-binding protein EngB required for normal cell division
MSEQINTRQTGETTDGGGASSAVSSLAATAKRATGIRTAEAGLRRVAELADELGAEDTSRAAWAVAQRVSEGLFYVACVGQFKRGKSTLLNALIGRSILPAGVIPVTTIPTVIRFGESLGAQVRFRNAEWTSIPVNSIEEYVSEEKNSENAKGVEGLEVCLPSPLLDSGMCLVDTPGLGSVHSGNTEATRAFIPHIDAAIVVIGADPPLSGEELQLVEMVAREIQDLVFVLNKADRSSESERSVAIAFARRVIESRLKRTIPAVFEISALEQIEGRGEGRDWAKFLRTLEHLVRDSERSLVRQAAERGLRRTTSQLLVVIEEERAALERPVEESERRIAELRKISERAAQSLHELGYLFAAEQQRLSKSFEDRRNAFLEHTGVAAKEAFEKALKGLPRKNGAAFRRDAMHKAQEIARVHITPWLETEERNAEEGYARIAQRFIDLANGFLERIREAGVSGPGVLPETLESEHAFRTRSRFYFHELEALAAPASPFRFVKDLLLGIFGAYGPIVGDAQEFLDHLLETNSTRVQNDVDDRVLESRRRLEGEIRRAIADVGGVANRALAHAREVQAAGAPAVELVLSRLEAAKREVLGLGLRQEN